MRQAAAAAAVASARSAAVQNDVCVNVCAHMLNCQIGVFCSTAAAVAREPQHVCPASINTYSGITNTTIQALSLTCRCSDIQGKDTSLMGTKWELYIGNQTPWGHGKATVGGQPGIHQAQWFFVAQCSAAYSSCSWPGTLPFPRRPDQKINGDWETLQVEVEKSTATLSLQQHRTTHSCCHRTARCLVMQWGPAEFSFSSSKMSDVQRRLPLLLLLTAALKGP
jgi:hypothetical protein